MLRTIAIVGGGSVAVSYLFHLVDELGVRRASGAAGLRVLVFESRERVGRGSAYEEDLDSNLLNVSVGAMSVSGSDRGHFARWLADKGIASFNGAAITESSFVSRPLFGAYLESVYAQTIVRASLIGITIEHVREAALSLEDAGDGRFQVATQARAWTVDHVVLSIGNLASAAFRELRGHPRYLASPYPTRDIVGRVGPHDTVCVLGTSLSAIDAIVALNSAGHQGRIMASSRQGRLPSVRGLQNRPVRVRPEFRAALAGWIRSGRRLEFEELAAHLLRELEQCGIHRGDDFPAWDAPPRDALAFLRRETELATTRPRQWQSFANALNEVIDLLWQVLSDAARALFEARYRSLWMTTRVSFPLENARILLRMLEGGSLVVVPGFRRVGHDDQRAKFVVDAASGSGPAPAAPREFEADWVINATSFSSDAAQAEHRLVQGLLARGLARTDPFGGLRLDHASGCLVDAAGATRPDFTVLGTMASGTYFWTNSMDVNARLAMGQARRLSRRWV